MDENPSDLDLVMERPYMTSEFRGRSSYIQTNSVTGEGNRSIQKSEISEFITNMTTYHRFRRLNRETGGGVTGVKTNSNWGKESKISEKIQTS